MRVNQYRTPETEKESTESIKLNKTDQKKTSPCHAIHTTSGFRTRTQSSSQFNKCTP